MTIPVEPDAVDMALARHPDVSHVALVHHETTTGSLNPLPAVAQVVARRGRRLLVDATSSLFGEPLTLCQEGIDFVTASAAKGVPARIERYAENARVLRCGMRRLGFEMLLSEEARSSILTTFRLPTAVTNNGLSARIVGEAGFEGIWASGLTMSAAAGVRDNNELSWSQVVDQVGFMAKAASIPILLDGDTGYGNFKNMRRLVRKLERVAGPDQVLAHAHR